MVKHSVHSGAAPPAEPGRHALGSAGGTLSEDALHWTLLPAAQHATTTVPILYQTGQQNRILQLPSTPAT